ncbi:hypothetical protein CMO96_00320 [Candidatus Woesebacteria bacterium]|nr:hypothetical protein [Candidatus Woesebacteria bacterium]
MSNRIIEEEANEFGNWVKNNHVPLAIMYFRYFSKAKKCQIEDECVAPLDDFVVSIWDNLEKDNDYNWQHEIDRAREHSRNELLKADWRKN